MITPLLAVPARWLISPCGVRWGVRDVASSNGAIQGARRGISWRLSGDEHESVGLHRVGERDRGSPRGPDEDRLFHVFLPGFRR
jgi:hypothetical protein